MEATKLGAVEVLEKPIPTKNLLAAVAAALSRGGEKDVNPRLQQANFGKSPAMRALKKSLLLASANKRPAFFVCPAVGAGEFFARFLAGAGAPVVTLEREAQLEGDLNALARRAEGGLLVARLFDFANPTLQIGLAGALREARRRNTRVVVCCEKPPAELEGAAAATDAGAALLKEISSCVVRLPRLPECKDDLPAVFDLIIKTLSDDTEKAGAALSAAAREELQSQIANAEFDELLAVLRSALLCSRGKTLDAATVKTMAAKWIRPTQPPVTKELEGLYAMPFRKAREMFEREYFLRLINLTDGNIPGSRQKSRAGAHLFLSQGAPLPRKHLTPPPCYNPRMKTDNIYAIAIKQRAERGDAQAQNGLAVMYAKGKGVRQSDAEMIKWLRRSAEQGVAQAQFNLGLMYRRGTGVPKDPSEAIKWYRLAAEQGDADAQNTLGVMYADGEGILRDNREAHLWLGLAAKNGCKAARDNLKKTAESLSLDTRFFIACKKHLKFIKQKIKSSIILPS